MATPAELIAIEIAPRGVLLDQPPRRETIPGRRRIELAWIDKRLIVEVIVLEAQA